MDQSIKSTALKMKGCIYTIGSQMKDSEVTIGQIKTAVGKYLDSRGWNGKQNPKNVVTSLVLEAAELLENFQWDTPQEAREKLKNPASRKKVEKEMADVLFYLADLAQQNGIDLSSAFFEKLEVIKEKYPEGIGTDGETYHKIKDYYRRTGKN